MNLNYYNTMLPRTGARLKAEGILFSCVRKISLFVLAVIALMACVAFSLFIPALFVFFWLMLIAFLPKNPNVSIALSTLNVIFIFGWMNMEKIPINDWLWYTTHYKWLEEMPLSSYLGAIFNGMTIKVTEPVYHTLSAIVSRVTSGSVPALALVVTITIYGSVSAGIAMLVGKNLKSAFEAVLVTWIPLSVGITFTLTTQLVRQEIAASLLFMSLAMLWTQRKKLGWIFLVLALLTHNSAAFPALCILASAYCINKLKTPGKYWVPLSILIGGAMGGSMILSPGGENYYISQQNDGSVSISIYILDAILICALIYARRYLAELKDLVNTLLASLIAYIFFIVAISPAPLLLLRMYFYMDFFRAATLTILVIAALKSRCALLLGVPAILLAFAYVEARLMTSPFYFFGGLISHLLRPFAFF